MESRSVLNGRTTLIFVTVPKCIFIIFLFIHVLLWHCCENFAINVLHLSQYPCYFFSNFEYMYAVRFHQWYFIHVPVHWNGDLIILCITVNNNVFWISKFSQFTLPMPMNSFLKVQLMSVLTVHCSINLKIGLNSQVLVWPIKNNTDHFPICEKSIICSDFKR